MRSLRSLIGGIRGRIGSDAPDDRIATDGGTATGGATGNGGLVSRQFLSSLPFWGPPAVLVGIFVYGAIGWNFIISLTDWDGLGEPSYDSFDFDLYGQLWADLVAGFTGANTSFFVAFRNTFVLLVVFTVACLIAGLGLAVLVDRDIRAENGFRTIYLLPMSLSFVVTAKFWAWIYNPTSGALNVTLKQFGVYQLLQSAGLVSEPIKWISNPKVTLFAVIFALLWQFSGYAMVVYLAGLRAIPDEHYEAAKVDGATTLRMYRRVILPQLRASTVSAAVVLMVFALKAFDFLFVMFGKNPGPAADILATMMYREAFSALNWAYGSAIAIVLFLLALTVVGPYLYTEYKRGAL